VVTKVRKLIGFAALLLAVAWASSAAAAPPVGKDKGGPKATPPPAAVSQPGTVTEIAPKDVPRGGIGVHPLDTSGTAPAIEGPGGATTASGGVGGCGVCLVQCWQGWGGYGWQDSSGHAWLIHHPLWCGNGAWITYASDYLTPDYAAVSAARTSLPTGSSSGSGSYR
jgi:hypothetical protein